MKNQGLLMYMQDGWSASRGEAGWQFEWSLGICEA